MKNSILALSLLLLVTGFSEVRAKTGEMKSTTSLALSYEEELELLEEYVPEAVSYEESNFSTVQVYAPNGELIMQGIIQQGEEIENAELRGLLDNSEFLMSVNEIALYRLEE